MRGLKGGFLSKNDHRANENHSREEVTKAINKLNFKLPTVFWTQMDE